jgi:tetratricopeptide (TPR) repeat protein
MRRILLLSPDIPGAQSILLLEQADTEADYGHLEQADDLSRVAAKLIEHDGNKEAAADCLAQAALREAEVGNSKRAQAFLSQSQKLSDGPETLTLAALVVARLGDLKHAEALSAELDKQWPAGTFIQRYWLPIIRAEIDIQQGRSSKAIDDLAVATPLELAGPSALPVATIYPAYVRGQAYLAAGDGKRASAEFQKLTDHAGLVLNFPLGALAHLGLARAYNRSGDLEKARQAYQDFLTLWKEADPHIPILKEAKAEYAKLQ